MKISAFLPVYNEESRIRYILQSLQWCDEVIVVDKESADNTVNICLEYGAKVFTMPNSDAFSVSEWEFLRECKGDWILTITASDIIDKSLAMEIRKQINVLPENVGCIKVPFKNYILGIEDERSPWHCTHRMKVFRRSNYTINSSVHGALSYTNDQSYTIPDKYGYISHLSHVSLDMMLDRHTRYWRGEANMYSEKSLVPALKAFWESVKEVTKRRKTFFLGWDGIALSFAYVSYFMFSFLYIWEHRRKENAQQYYEQLRERNYEIWKDYKSDNNEALNYNNKL